MLAGMLFIFRGPLHAESGTGGRASSSPAAHGFAPAANPHFSFFNAQFALPAAGADAVQSAKCKVQSAALPASYFLPMRPLEIGIADDWWMLADISLTGAQAGLGAIGIIVCLIGYHFVLGRYIREQAHVKEPHITTISDQPVEVRAAVQFIARHELDERLGSYVTTGELHGVEKRIDDKLEKNFRDLDDKRSRSIGNLHEHLTGTANSLGEKIEDGDQRTHERTDALAQQVGVLIGEVRGLTKACEQASEDAKSAAISAARAGGRRA